MRTSSIDTKPERSALYRWLPDTVNCTGELVDWTPRLSSNESQFVLRLSNPTRLLFSHGVSAWKFKKGWKLSKSSFSLAIPFACSGFEASEGSPIRLASHQSEPDRGQVSTKSIATGGPGNVSHDYLFSANSSLRFEKSPPWSRGVRNRFYLLRGTVRMLCYFLRPMR